MTDTKKLDEQRAAQIEALHNKIREFVDEGVKPFAEAHAELQAGMKEINERFDRLEAQSRIMDAPGAAEEAKAKGFSLSKVARSLIAKANQDSKWRDYAGLEWDISDASRANDPSTSPDQYGGFIVPPVLQQQLLIEPYMDYLVPAALGATVLQGLTGSPVLIPKLIDWIDADTLVEHQEATDKEVEFGQIRLEPRTAQAVVNPSRELLNMGTGADRLLRDLIGKSITKKISAMAFAGTGSTGQPVGVKNAPGVQAVDFAAGTYAVASPYDHGHELYYKLLEMEGKLEDIDALQDSQNASWAMAAKAKRAIMGMKSQNAAAGTESLDVNRASVFSAAEDSILGYGYRTTGGGLVAGAQTDLILGDWSQMILGYWGGLVIEASASTERAMRRREVMLSAYQMYDVNFFKPEAFCVATNFNTTTI